MENIIYLDTHVVVWLYSGRTELISKMGQDEIRRNEIVISPVVKLELKYLYETERINTDPKEIYRVLSGNIGLKTVDGNINEIIESALSLDWTKDPFDKIIVAQALLDNRKLLTKDKKILDNYKFAIW